MTRNEIALARITGSWPVPARGGEDVHLWRYSRGRGAYFANQRPEPSPVNHLCERQRRVRDCTERYLQETAYLQAVAHRFPTEEWLSEILKVAKEHAYWTREAKALKRRIAVVRWWSREDTETARLAAKWYLPWPCSVKGCTRDLWHDADEATFHPCQFPDHAKCWLCLEREADMRNEGRAS